MTYEKPKAYDKESFDDVMSDHGKQVATFCPTTYGSMFAIHTYENTRHLIDCGEDVTTTQMCLINRAKGYDIIRIVNGPQDVIEIINNHDNTYSCDRTQRKLRRVHNLFHLWENGEFS